MKNNQYKSRTSSSSTSSKMIKYYFSIFFSRLYFSFFIILSIVAINISISNKNFNTTIRSSIIPFFKPFYIITKFPFDSYFSFIESIKNILQTNKINKRLKEENLLLKDLYLKNVEVKKINSELKEILNFVDNIDNKYKYITSKIYIRSKNQKIHSIIINAGLDDGIKEGDLVLGINRGVIGRVVNLSNKNSKILLLTDINSNIPARNARNNERFILSGTNSSYLKISYYNSKIPDIKDGDIIYTSGFSDVIPDGIPIGAVRINNNEAKVEMFENINKIFTILVLIKK